MLFVGSCFATEIGSRFADNRFAATVNPYGVMYNPASIVHTIERYCMTGNNAIPDTVIITLGTNHVYILNETGEIVDNCQKRPQYLFTERQLTKDECTDYLTQAMDILRKKNPDASVILTVSPIRYQKYGFHESQLSKATLLLAADDIVRKDAHAMYFPAYELMNDELRDYRFYKPDMLHPSEQAADYIHDRFCEAFLTNEAKQFIKEWQPIKKALTHRPFNPDSKEYITFITQQKEKEREFLDRWK